MINKVILVGNLGKDPEIRTMSNSRQVASFSLATTESWNDKNTGERVSKTEWHNVVVFNDALVKVIQNYVHKGSKVYLEGALQTRKWTDNNGNDRYTTEVVLNQYNSTLKILTSKNQQAEDWNASNQHQDPSATESNEKPQFNNQQSSTDSGDLDDDDIPF